MATKVEFAQSDMAVLVCRHVAGSRRKVSLVHRDQDGEWWFLCDRTHGSNPDDYKVVGVGHVTTAQPELHRFADLGPGWSAERDGKGNWARSVEK